MINQQENETRSLLATASRIHRNIRQTMEINTTSVLFLMETASVESLANKTIEPAGDAQIHLPLSFRLPNHDPTQTVFLQVSDFSTEPLHD